MNPVKLTTHSNIAIISIDNPPVNALSQPVRQGLWDAIQTIEADTTILAAILICQGRTFIAGADIAELSAPPQPPHLNDLVDALEHCSKPLIAAIHKQALGGGLEIALGCSHRIATVESQFGLPEVKLGLIPGAGGTQRLPRLIGIEETLKVVVEGKTLNAQQALDLGLIDTIAEDNLQEQALLLTQKVMTTKHDHHYESTPLESEVNFEAWRKKLHKRQRGFQAPQTAIDMIEQATLVPYSEAKQKERVQSLQLRKSPQSLALQHIFMAERKAMKIDTSNQSMTFKHVAVIGSGTMGAGIAAFFALAGLKVTLLDISESALETGLSRIQNILDQSLKRAKITEAQYENTLALIKTSTDYATLADTDLVIEAAVENLELKQQIFKTLDQTCKPSTILATNTSYLDINLIAEATQRPAQIIGLHFFSPAHIMKLVEIVCTDHVSDSVIHSVAKLLKRLGKVSVKTGVCHGFIGNRMYQCYQREVGLLLLEGATPKQIDTALYDFGMAMGPLFVFDLSGLDISYLMRKSLPEGVVHPHAFQVHDQLVEMERKGRKTGAGFYDYVDGKQEESELVISIIKTTAERFGYQQQTISAEVIIQRCMQALANEGSQILEEGIAECESDIDVVFVNGYGFPRYRGGPMFLAKS